MPEDLFVTILKGETPSIRTELPKYLEAPLAKGENRELLVETRDGENVSLRLKRIFPQQFSRSFPFYLAGHSGSLG